MGQTRSHNCTEMPSVSLRNVHASTLSVRGSRQIRANIIGRRGFGGLIYIQVIYCVYLPSNVDDEFWLNLM